ncbi:MAG: polymerase epsilon subunit [Bacteroidetes bacterium]|nr:polymerase epsilon subunit [Bacteroidota bacterium]
MHLSELPLAIVDIETTGGNPVYNRIIEIAVIRIEQGRAIRTYQSLVHPERFIPPTIEHLTGIRNEDVATAPRFRSVANNILEILDGAVFVAHNARFDYGFLRAEFARYSIRYEAKCLCTVKLSRRLYPEFRRHDLSSVIQRHSIICIDRHRALGDAQAVVDFLALAQRDHDRDRIAAAVASILKTNTLPSHLDREMIDALPERPGVYFFHGEGGELLYVGKSKNIRERVLGHFSASNERQMHGQVCRIEFRQTAGELGALLLESQLIKELQPLYNQASRRKRNIVVARRELTKEGYATVVLEEIDHVDLDESLPIVGMFKSIKQAKEFLLKIARQHQLCRKLLGLERARGHCFPYHLHQCHGACMGEEAPESHNVRFDRAFVDRRVKAWPFKGAIVIDERGEENAGEIFLIDQWRLVSGFKYSDIGHEHHLKSMHRFDYDSYKILLRYLRDGKNRRNIRVVPREEFELLLNQSLAPAA